MTCCPGTSANQWRSAPPPERHPSSRQSRSLQRTLTLYLSERSYRTVWRKNVAPVTDGRRNYEQNFTRALASLNSRGLIEIDEWGNISPTDAGRAVACKALGQRAA